MKPVLMCGGRGTKMWPLSRRAFPKHFLPLFEGKSLFQLNFEVLARRFSPAEIYVQTNAEQAKIAQKQVPAIPRENYFIEPEMRNHGPATGLMAAKLYHLSPEEPFIVVQADVLREPGEAFLMMIEEVERLIKEKGKLVTGGIRPSWAMMGVDYLVAKKRINRRGKVKIYQMERWLGRESSREEVEKYFQEKAVFIHANHYAWTPRLLLEAYRRWAPDWYQPLKRIIEAIGKPTEEEVIKREYQKMEKAPVERVTKEVLVDGYVVEVPFQWVDFGTWESLVRYRRQKKKEEKDDFLLVASSDCSLIRGGKKKRFVAVVGGRGLIIVETDDALLVVDEKETGRVGEVVEYLEKEKREELV